MKPPIVSVVLPVFNRAELLPRAVSSVQSQHFSDWELLVVDDNSTDDTPSVAAALASSDERIRLISNTNSKGPSGARNCGLDQTTGKFIAYLDSDDEWKPHHLETAVQYLDRHPDLVDIVTANAQGRRQSTGEVYQWTDVRKDHLEYDELDGGWVVYPESAINEEVFARLLTLQTMVGKANVMKSVRWDESLPAATDMMYDFELVIKRYQVCYLNDVHVTYWVHDGNMTNTLKHLTSDQLSRIMPGYIAYWDRVLSFPSLTRSQRQFAKSSLARTWAWQFGYCGLEQVGNYREARRCYFKALRVTPANYKIWWQLAKNYIKSATTSRSGVAS